MESIITFFLIYLLSCYLDKSMQTNHLFLLKCIQTLKINKFRNTISSDIKIYERRKKWFLIWPIIRLYEGYENWQKNRN